VREILIAVNATVEGQTTAHYITEQLVRVRSSRSPGWPMACRWAASSIISMRARLAAAIRARTAFLGELLCVKFLNPDTMPMPASNYVQMPSKPKDPRRRLIISGQIGVAANGRVSQGYDAQAEQAWCNALAGLEAAWHEAFRYHCNPCL
jgi:enamine deaminase RidA (YjgF/YER057c/UK114 family)